MENANGLTLCSSDSSVLSRLAELKRAPFNFDSRLVVAYCTVLATLLPNNLRLSVVFALESDSSFAMSVRRAEAI